MGIYHDPTLHMQETLTFWAALLFSYVNAPYAGTYIFQVNSDNGARLWVDSVLVVNATCTYSQQQEQHCAGHHIK